MKYVKRNLVFLGTIITSLLIGAGLAVAANTIVIEFGTGSFKGDVVVNAPPPASADVELTMPQFELTLGDTTPLHKSIIVTNNSDTDLTFVLGGFSITMDDSNMGTIQPYWDYVPVFDTILEAHTSHEIPIEFIPSGVITKGKHSYSGSMEYSY